MNYDSDRRTATITPDSRLAPNLEYTVTITTQVEDLAGLHVDSNVSWNFTTGNSLREAWSWLAAGGWHSLGIKEDGTLWVWGWNENGQLGDGTSTDQHLPVPVQAAEQ